MSFCDSSTDWEIEYDTACWETTGGARLKELHGLNCYRPRRHQQVSREHQVSIDIKSLQITEVVSELGWREFTGIAGLTKARISNKSSRVTRNELLHGSGQVYCPNSYLVIQTMQCRYFRDINCKKFEFPRPTAIISCVAWLISLGEGALASGSARVHDWRISAASWIRWLCLRVGLLGSADRYLSKYWPVQKGNSKDSRTRSADNFENMMFRSISIRLVKRMNLKDSSCQIYISHFPLIFKLQWSVVSRSIGSDIDKVRRLRISIYEITWMPLASNIKYSFSLISTIGQNKSKSYIYYLLYWVFHRWYNQKK